MMKKIFHIGFQDLRLMVRDKTFFFWSLVFPLVFIFIFGSMFKGGGDASKAQAALTVLNQDKGKWGAYFVEKIKSPGIDMKEVKKIPEKYYRLLVIPEDFSEKIEAKTSQELVFKKKEGANLEAAKQVEIKLIQGTAKLITELIVNRDIPPNEFFEKKKEFRDIVQLKSSFPDKTIKKVPSGFDHIIPGTIIHFIMMMVLIYGGITVMEDRKRGVLSRILFSSVSIPGLFGGKFLGRLSMGLLQAFILIVTGVIFFKLNLGSYFLSALTVIVFSIAMAALSIFVGSVFQKEDMIVGISVLCANIFAALGGCWWPIEIVPETFRFVGMISPAYWAMDAFHQNIFFHNGFGDVALNFLVLIGWAVLFTFLAVKYFKIKE